MIVSRTSSNLSSDALLHPKKSNTSSIFAPRRVARNVFRIDISPLQFRATGPGLSAQCLILQEPSGRIFDALTEPAPTTELEVAPCMSPRQALTIVSYICTCTVSTHN